MVGYEIVIVYAYSKLLVVVGGGGGNRQKLLQDFYQFATKIPTSKSSVRN